MRTSRLLLAGLLLLGLGTQLVPAQGDLTALEEAAMKAAIERVADSVVRIQTVGGLEKVEGVLIGTGPTTGLVVDPDGYIVSSAFNFIQRPTSILVTLPGGEKTAAEIVARDHSRNVVLLKVNVDDPLPVPTAVPRKEMAVGQWCIAVGRTFGDDFPNISVGILSATNRIWGRAIQTDCKVSPANYGGPLLDIQGRVYGILLPLSPQETTETAGSEWYDSGIGFAVPLADVFDVLDKLKQGETLHRGLLGVTLKGTNVFADPAIVASAPAGTPAAKAGLKEGDKIVEFNGQTVKWHRDLKQAMGRHYAGDQVELVVMRNDKSRRLKITLTDAIAPYQLPLLGILPMRGEEQVTLVRYVLPNTPAATAGIAVGDQLTRLDGISLQSADEWRNKIAGYSPGETVNVSYQRDGKNKTVKLKLATQIESIPDVLPPAIRLDDDGEKDKAEEAEEAEEAKDPEEDEAQVGEAENDESETPSEAELVTIKLPEEPNECVALIPADYDGRVPHGVVIWLSAPGAANDEELKQRWESPAQDHDLIILAPKATDKKRWHPTEADFVRKTLDHVMRKYTVDPQRVVVHGYRAGSSLGFLVAFRNRDVVRGVAAVDAVIPMRMRLRANDPVERLAFYFSWSDESKLAKKIDANVETLREFKFPVTVNSQTNDTYLSDDEVSALARWIDSLDRL